MSTRAVSSLIRRHTWQSSCRERRIRSMSCYASPPSLATSAELNFRRSAMLAISWQRRLLDPELVRIRDTLLGQKIVAADREVLVLLAHRKAPSPEHRRGPPKTNPASAGGVCFRTRGPTLPRLRDVLAGDVLCPSLHAAQGIVRPLRPPQLLEIAILRFGVIAREPGYAEQSTSPIRGIRPAPQKIRLSGLSCGMTCAPWP
jgi:hypothetical protein